MCFMANNNFKVLFKKKKKKAILLPNKLHFLPNRQTCIQKSTGR